MSFVELKKCVRAPSSKCCTVTFNKHTHAPNSTNTADDDDDDDDVDGGSGVEMEKFYRQIFTGLP